MTPGEKALKALRLLAKGAGSVTAIGDYVYDIREREGEGWEGPRVKAWSDGAQLAAEALREAAK